MSMALHFLILLVPPLPVSCRATHSPALAPGVTASISSDLRPWAGHWPFWAPLRWKLPGGLGEGRSEGAQCLQPVLRPGPATVLQVCPLFRERPDWRKEEVESLPKLGPEERLCSFPVWKPSCFPTGPMGFGPVSEGREDTSGRANRWTEIDHSGKLCNSSLSQMTRHHHFGAPAEGFVREKAPRDRMKDNSPVCQEEPAL